MSKQKYWQAEASFSSGGTFVFGVTGGSLPVALRKAYERTADVPGVAGHLTVTRLYSRHHPLHRLSRGTGID